MKQVVQLAQVNYRYGNNVFFPYSVGLIQAYSLSQPDIAEAYEFRTPLFLREPIAKVLAGIDRLDVLGLSCYIWNWEYCKALAKAVRSKFPSCLIVMGGPQVPRSNPDFFREHSYVDAVVPHEGELVFANILREKDGGLSRVDGLMLNVFGYIHTTKPAARVDDLAKLPSPYLEGIFDSLLGKFEFQASQETHRGCPYQCTFCDWGSATMSKVRRFGNERLEAEFDWMGRNKIELLYNCDANYGIFRDDIDLTERLVETKRRYGFPSKFRAAYAKNSNERVYDIAAALNAEGMCKGVTLSFQSMDAGVLDIVKRKNMKSNDFKSLITMYRKAQIPTYTELILGLPGETYDSFCDGIETLLEAGQHDSLNIYHAMLLPNSEMNQKAYREAHGIRGIRTPLLLLHGSKEAGDVDEYYDVVIETSTLSVADWVKASLFGYVVQAFHCMNLSQQIAIWLHHNKGLSYRAFYEGLIEYARANPAGELWGLLHRILVMLNRVCAGRGSFDMEDRDFGDVMWPVEELLFLWVVKDVIVDDMHAYVHSLAKGDAERLIQKQVASTLWPDSELPDFARQVVWYGRKGGSMKAEVTC